MQEKGLGMRLQEARKAAGLTQQELCQKSGLSYSTLAKIERGAIKSPSIFTVQQIALVLGTSVDALLGPITIPSLAPAKKISKSGVSFVYFDVNGCLVRFFHQAFAKIAEDTDVNPDIIETTYWHYNDAVCRGDLSLADFNAVMAEQFNVKNFDWATYYLGAVDAIQESRELLLWAHEHYKVGLLSNILPGAIKTMIERGTLPDIPYDAIIDSSEVRSIKPEQKIFEIAQAQAGVNASEILLIDDTRANLMAAERAGWKVVWFDDFQPDASAKRIKDILAF